MRKKEQEANPSFYYFVPAGSWRTFQRRLLQYVNIVCQPKLLCMCDIAALALKCFKMANCAGLNTNKMWCCLLRPEKLHFSGAVWANRYLRFLRSMSRVVQYFWSAVSGKHLLWDFLFLITFSVSICCYTWRCFVTFFKIHFWCLCNWVMKPMCHSWDLWTDLWYPIDFLSSVLIHGCIFCFA